MDIGALEGAVRIIKMVGHRQGDGTLTLTDGTNIEDWPTTMTLVSGTVMRLTNVPNPGNQGMENPETAWYEL